MPDNNKQNNQSIPIIPPVGTNPITPDPSDLQPISTENVDVPPPPIITTQEGSKESLPQTDVAVDTATTPTSPPPYDLPPVITTTPLQRVNRKFISKKMVATILGILVLLGGVGAGIFLTSQSQDIREKATGQCNLTCPDGQYCDPRTSQCQNKEPYESFCEYDFECDSNYCELPIGTCQDNPEPSTINLTCNNIKVYKVIGDTAGDPATWTWTEIPTADIYKLTVWPDEDYYFVVKGTYTKGGGTIDKARFTFNTADPVNGILKSGGGCTATLDTPCNVDFYTKLDMSTLTVKSLDIKAQLHYTGNDTWF